MLAQRYASPFVVLDEMLQCGTFYEFILEINQITYEEREESQLWDIWLHKIFDGTSFRDWKADLKAKAEARFATKAELVATVKDSMAILNSFNPVDGG